MSESIRHDAADQQERDDRDDALIIHLSDTHISAAGTNPARPNPQYDSRAAFDADCARIAQSGLRPNLIAVSGDICDAEVGERACVRGVPLCARSHGGARRTAGMPGGVCDGQS
ncbi:hypothetical protein [Bifidobacterium felsineum]|uniref:hypothetical protein n=1 Tax=Bifidobacterium felsineum TaxID=2045440 RepID=UPI0013FD8CF6|nr:hypothetical protein [Bifidobacterium felsineum]